MSNLPNEERVECEEGFAELTLPRVLERMAEVLRYTIENDPNNRQDAINSAILAINGIGAVLAHIREI